ncbi:MAG: gfo/Idh/MocA family oxidoreductase, partial [Planctomycetaceae bacterium]|nr:gfo/Idh/MocA family oxidoreductase [Planctomycetaceae bacterium]
MMGNQGTALDTLRRAVATVESGVLGNISEVHVWTNRPVWPQGIERPTEVKGNPNSLHWDEWIGPAPYRPYNEAYHPFKWRGFWDFGTGALGDMACHTLNMPYWAVDLKDPIAVSAETSGHNRETYPGWSVITFEFPATDKRGPVKLMWYDGGKKPDPALLGDATQENSGALIVGEAGKLYATGDYCDDFKLLGDLEAPKVE